MQQALRVKLQGICCFQAAYLALWLVAFEALTFLSLVILAQANYSFSDYLVFFVILVNVPVVQRFVQVIFALAVEPHDLPKTGCLDRCPEIALLYCTCDDAVLDCMRQLASQAYPRCTAFILDDSQSEYYRKLVDSTGIRVVRRGTRRGFKAGNLNHWLSSWGENYDYFVIVDADSFLPETFVAEMLLYAEHPENCDVAMFESKIQPYNRGTRLARALSIHAKIDLFLAERLNNRLGITLSAGHNNLCRTRDIKEIGGFDERYISEDHATTLNLLTKGKVCRLVDVFSYEGVPDNLQSFKRRAARWARSDFQLLKHSWSETSLLLQMHLLLKSLVHFLWMPYLLGMLYCVWGFSTSWRDFVAFVRFLFLEQGLWQPEMATVCLLFFIYFAHLFIAYIPIGLVLKLPARSYLWGVIYGMCLGFVSLIPIVIALGKTLMRRPFHFEPTPKLTVSPSAKEYLTAIWPTIILGSLILLGVLHNPMILVFNWTWIVPLVVAPLFLYEPASLRLGRIDLDRL